MREIASTSYIKCDGNILGWFMLICSEKKCLQYGNRLSNFAEIHFPFIYAANNSIIFSVCIFFIIRLPGIVSLIQSSTFAMKKALWAYSELFSLFTWLGNHSMAPSVQGSSFTWGGGFRYKVIYTHHMPFRSPLDRQYTENGEISIPLLIWY